MGRKTKLTPERHKRIVRAIKSGNYADTAARANGIDQATYYRWLKRAEECEKDEHGEPVNPEDAIYCQFREDIKTAEAQAEARHVQNIETAAANGTWQASAWTLERKYPDRYGRIDRVKQEISGPEGGPVKIDAEAAVLGFLSERADAMAETEADGAP